MKTYTASSPDAKIQHGLSEDSVIDAMIETVGIEKSRQLFSILRDSGTVTYDLMFCGKRRKLTIRVENSAVKAYTTVSQTRNAS